MKKIILITLFSLILIPTKSFSKEIILKCIQFKSKILKTEEVKYYNEDSTIYSIIFFSIKNKKIKILKGKRIYNPYDGEKEEWDMEFKKKVEYKLSNQTETQLIFNNDEKRKYIIDRLDYGLKYIQTDISELEFKCNKIDKLI